MATFELSLRALPGLEDETERAARRGDRAAWSALVARHHRQVVLSLLARGVLPDRARELAQDTWARLISQADAHRLDELRLPGLAIRQALFLAKSAARREHSSEAVENAASDESHPSAEQRYQTLERLERARALLETLHPSARAVFSTLYSQPHLSHAEVAAQVGLSVQRVRQIICEVRKVLRTALEGEDP